MSMALCTFPKYTASLDAHIIYEVYGITPISYEQKL